MRQGLSDRRLIVVAVVLPAGLFITMAAVAATNGNDTLVGTDSADTIYAYAGSDTVSGKLGNDSMYGDYGTDTLYGRSAADSTNSGADTIYEGHDAGVTIISMPAVVAAARRPGRAVTTSTAAME